ncbi:berberine bridge enzyme-like 13 [Abeliophyllum distichum]|uniref:Berberine bridge enzyme-like 13 n=1 Tax=Abeliophyllum distichum TaxID=126358 RepID=A0ABD1UM80_9LAMI
MRIFKEDGQWVEKTKGFNDELGPSTLPLESGEEMDADEDAPLPRPRSQRPSSSTFSFTFTEDHYNLLNGQIDSLTSMVVGLHHTVRNLQQSVNSMTSLLQALHSHLDAVLPLHPPHPPPEH